MTVYPCLCTLNLLQLQNVTSNEAVKLVVSNDLSDVLFECGYNKPLTNIQLSHREEIVKVVWLHYVFFRPHAELDQLRKGFLETL